MILTLPFSWSHDLEHILEILSLSVFILKMGMILSKLKHDCMTTNTQV